MRTAEGRKNVIAAVLAALLATLEVSGYQISMNYQTTVHQSAFFQKMGILSVTQCIAVYFLTTVVIFVTVRLLFSILEKAEKTSAEERRFLKKDFALWLFLTILLFLCWMPCYLADYPGFYNYDAFSQIPQVLYDEVPYNAHHPLIHTLLMGKIISFGYYHGVDLNSGIALHSICQMGFCASAFSFVICYIRKLIGGWLYKIAFCYYAFFPPIAMFSMSTTKDVLFSVLLLFTVIFIHDMFQDLTCFFYSKWKICRFLVTVILMCLFRKNGIYAFLCIVPFLLIFEKKYTKQMLLLCCTAVFSYFIISRYLVLVLDAEDGSAKEMMCVPMQQVARVYNDYGEAAFSAEELSLIYAGISETDLLNYNPFLADNIKNYFEYSVIQNHKTPFLMLWVQKGIEYPESYVRAFLDNTYQAWYPGTSIIKLSGSNETSYFSMKMYAGGYRDTKIPSLLQFYDKIARGFYYQKIPFVRLFFSVGAMFWIVLFTFAYALYRRKRSVKISILLILTCCLTVFAGPVSLVRYYLILFYAFPLCIAFCMEGQKEKQR